MRDPVVPLSVRLVLAGVAGGLLLAAFPPVGLWWTAPLGMAVLLGALTGVGLRRAYGLCVLTGLVLFLPLLEWTRFLGVGPGPRCRCCSRWSSRCSADFTPGSTVGLLALQGIPLAVGTCFEVAFDDLPRDAVRAGGQLLVLPSNNASYGRSGQSAQQLSMARLRAVEHARSTVVPTTSGISALIRPDGEVVEKSGLFEPAVLQAALPRRTSLTLATRFGGQVELGLAALVLLPMLLRPRRAWSSGDGA